MEQKKIVARPLLKHCRQTDSFDSRILRLPTVEEKNHEQDSNGISIQRSFHFNPLPVTENPLYYGVITLLMADKAEISLYPTFGFMRTLGESRDRFFTFHDSPLAFAEEDLEGSPAESERVQEKVWGATKKFASHHDAYFCLRSYYAWFVREVIPWLSLEELGRITRDYRGLKEEFISFRLRQPLY